jgi:hypothetical protein
MIGTAERRRVAVTKSTPSPSGRPRSSTIRSGASASAARPAAAVAASITA